MNARAKPSANSESRISELAWLDTARVLAIVGVVVLHVAANPVLGLPINSSEWWVANLYVSCTRWSVPVFVMVSGALLLNPHKSHDISSFYRIRARRILVPLIVWSLIYITFNYLTNAETYGAKDLFRGIVLGTPFYHLWFLFMIASLYLVTPFLRTIVFHTKKIELWLLVIVLFVMAASATLFASVFGSQATPFITLFLPFVPYFLIGHLIASAKPTPVFIPILSVMISIAVTALGCFAVASAFGLQKGLYFYDYLSVTTIPMSISIFLLLRRVTGTSSPLIRRLSQLAMGIYVVHPLFLILYRDVFSNYVMAILIPSLAVAAILSSLAASFAVSRVPYARRTM